MSTPTPPYEPPQQPLTHAPDTGSLGAGIAIAWATLFGGYTVIVGLLSALVSPQGVNDTVTSLIIASLLLPWVAMIGFIIFFAGRGQTRTAKGVAVGIATILGVALLLLAACFGLFSMTDFK